MLLGFPTRIGRSALLRLVLANAAVFLLATVALLAVVYFTTVNYSVQQLDKIISLDVDALTQRFHQEGTDDVIRAIRERIAEEGRGERLYLLADKDYAPLAGNLAKWPETLPKTPGWGWFEMPSDEGYPEGDGKIRTVNVALAGGLYLLVGRFTHELDATKETIWEALGWALVLAPVLAIASGGLMSFGIVRRLNRMNLVARDVTEGNLARRVPTAGRGDEFDQLAENINAMLGQIEKLVGALRNVSNNIAHDLRTPLSHLRTSLEVARRTHLEAAEYEAWIENMLADVDEILQTFEGMLKLAEIDSGELRHSLKPVDLVRVVSDVAEVYEAVADAKHQTFVSETTDVPDVKGDRDLLFRAIANVVDNAIKYAPEGGRIVVALRNADGTPELTVTDGGPGIPADARELVFRPLYRLDRSRGAPGRGLGLSIVAAVAALHGIEITLHDNQPGLKVVMRFPVEGAGRGAATGGKEKRRLALRRHAR